MFEKFMLMIAEVVIKNLLGRAEEELTKAVLKKELDKKRGVIDAENEKRYAEAKDRAERRKAALDLLNRNAH